LGPPASQKRNIDIEFEIDLGELVKGHHVIARGIELLPARAHLPGAGSVLYYDFVPAIANNREKRHGMWLYWKLYTSDDAGTAYGNRNGGFFDGRTRGEVSWGTRDLDGVIPDTASVLTLRFEPPSGWVPPEPWRRVIRVDLKNSRVMED